VALFAWLTVANGGRQSFRDARLQVIAGKPNKRENVPPPPPPSAWLNLQCWPADVTSTHPKQALTRLPLPSGPDLAGFNAVGSNAPGSFETRRQRRAREKAAADIIVTASRVQGSTRRERISIAMMAPPPPPPPPAPPAPPPPPAPMVAIAAGAQAKVEALGDLKLYRVPMRVTVAAQAQKQVAMLVQPDATFDRVYRLDLSNRYAPTGMTQAAPFELRAPNTTRAGLGVPLPAGTVALFARGGGRDLYAGEAPIDDRAVGEEIALHFRRSPDVTWTLTRVAETKDREDWRVDIGNARTTPIRVELALPFGLTGTPAGATRGGRGWIVPVDVAANGARTIAYTTKR
jgi:hypothetical protein